MQAVEDDDLAWELWSPRVARRTSTWIPRIAAAFGNGVVAGLLPSTIVLVVYFLQHRDAPLPWLKIASILALYGPGVGVLLAVLCEALVMITDRIARAGYGLVALANPVVACALAGLLAGIAPGAIGVVVFGSYHGPFVGTGLIAFGLIGGAMLVALPLAARARRYRGAPRNARMIAMATLIATLTLCAVAAVVAPVIVGSAFAEARHSVEEHGALVGAVAGAAGGGVVGVFIGLVIAISRGRAKSQASTSGTGSTHLRARDR